MASASGLVNTLPEVKTTTQAFRSFHDQLHVFFHFINPTPYCLVVLRLRPESLAHALEDAYSQTQVLVGRRVPS